MAGHTAIEWADATWNPIVGCSVVSPGCTNCYAMKMAARIIAMAGDSKAGLHYDKTVSPKSVWTGHVAEAPQHILTAILHWKKPRRIFVNSMGDLFHEAVPDAWIDRVFAVMALVPQHTFLVLTKRAQRMREYFSEGMAALCERWQPIMFELQPIDTPEIYGRETPLHQVWLGVSAEDQKRADERIPYLMSTPAAKRFISAEPLLSHIDLRGNIERSIYPHAISWVIVGGESGPGARPMHPGWARSLRDQCATAGVPFFFKQWGEWASVSEVAGPGEHHQFPNYATVRRVGKKAAGRLLDGIEHNGFPT